ncbi:RNA-directed DNA polymerase, eukaryota, partial [Tanacetum coccineum]
LVFMAMGSDLTKEDLETYTISAWKEAKLYLLKPSSEHGKIYSKRLAGPDENLKDLTLKILQNRVATLLITHSTSDDDTLGILYNATANLFPSACVKSVCEAVRGTWISSSLKLMFVSVYAPQDISERKSLWDYIKHMINLWDGEFSDHRPILLRESSVDYGPTPFRVFHSWFTKDGFDNLIADTWNNLSIMETNKISLLRKKFQALKAIIKNWSRDEMLKASAVRHSAQSRISELDKLIDKGLSNNDIDNERISLLKDIHDLDKRHSSDLAQKAKIQWAIEGDENSKYFHGIINKKWSQLAIRGVLADGEWIEDPPKVKNEFLEHFSNRFSMPTGQTINLDSHMFQKISIDQNADLESDVSLEEIKKAVWECGTNKSPGRWFFLRWIQACHSSAMGSILVNGSPSSEFKFYKGLKQGDPLSHFLFILVMESLHISFNNILNFGLYKGIRIDESLMLSHLFYADDAVFIEEVDVAANVIGCNTISSGLLLTSLCIMSVPLQPLELTFGRAVLSSLPIYLMSIYKTPVGVLRKMESIRRIFFNGADINENKMSKDSSLWYRVIKAMFGDGGALDNTDCNKNSTVAEKINASSISCSFRRLPRGSLEEEQFSKLIEDVNSVILSVSNDRWIWSLDSSGEFSIKSTRLFIDDHLLLAVGAPTRWVSEVPIKINIMAWKVSLDKLPT